VKRILDSAALLAGLFATSAMAQPPAQAPAKPQDPNQKICEKVEITGSRLSSKRVCMTRAQWADARLQDRQAVEHVQTHRGMKGE
jgi:Na+-transporting NADH:ubiquinone oxidoreductase subunit NqrC